MTIHHQKAVNAVAVSSDGRYIASGSDDNNIQVWDAETGAAVTEPMSGHSDVVTSVSFSPDCSRLVSGSKDSDLRIWNVDTGTGTSKPLTGHSEAVISVAFSPDNCHIVSSSRDKTIRIWDISTRTTLARTLGKHEKLVSSVTFSPCGQYVISGCYDKTIRMWDLESWETIFQFSGHTSSVTSVACSLDGRRIASGSLDQKVRVWDTKTGGAVHDAVFHHEGPVTSVAFFSDCRFIVSGSMDGTIRVWDTDSTTATLDSPTDCLDQVNSVACFPNSHRVVSGSSDKTVMIWDTTLGSVVSNLPSEVASTAQVSISNTMKASEIVKHLSNHNCVDVSGRLDMHRCDALPSAGGGSGDIYAGMFHDRRRVAIKTARVHIASNKDRPEVLKKIAHELYTWSKCHHENVLELYGVAQFRGHLAMVAPWMENGTLPNYLGRQPDLSNVDRYQLCVQMANGLAFLHQKSVIHGDVKGDNVLISKDGTAKLTDFGNAVLKEYTLQFSAEKDNPGYSTRWAAPEILDYRVLRCPEADVYALGMTFLEALTGELPYHHIYRDYIVISAVMIRKELPPRPEVLKTGSKNGDKLWSLLLSCWTYDGEE
ncbi:WD40 repeat-like protein, partial [Ceratobasidium sp. AG-I]